MKWFLNEESGQGMVEYGLILVLVSVVAIVALTAVGDSLKGIFEDIGNTLTGSN
ncbi:Flp family type IVb pilin [Proteinivorax tanatarense]|uniref:Flp family type IVb pilin n=1 Tax=Proteinivorax tanatarense TaxID=1260629 RepID=A0AAU7VJX8_9FIRM